MSAGGIAGFFCFIGLSLLLHRRLSDPRIRLTSHRTDIAILIILWVQLRSAWSPALLGSALPTAA
jgi:nitrate reductase gamma subunit